MKKTLVTGGAGFIGSHVVERLLEEGDRVVAYDDLSTGFLRHLDAARRSPRFRFVKGNLRDERRLRAAMKGCGSVVHLAANADVRFGLRHPERDLEENTRGTFRVLEAMRACGAKEILFSSTGSVYGEPAVFPTPEDAPFPRQTSLYGASKLAGEALISAYCEGFGLRGRVFRFVSILGERYSHGHVFDFCRKLLADPRRLELLGDGRQRKSYLHVGDCVSALLLARRRAKAPFEVFNLGVDDWCTAEQSARWIAARMGLKPRITRTGGRRGWVGDSPFIFLDARRIRRLGWKPRLGIRESVHRTLDWLLENRWILDRR
ncbi:MAG: NAD-dependent epimerase/dehydratase family protein [Elusimicrobiota bacterium]|jgi:UDP-glucose 4-epimerase